MKKIFRDNNGELRVGFALLLAIVGIYLPILVIGGISFAIFGEAATPSQIVMGLAGFPATILLTNFLLKRNFNKEHYQTFDFFNKKALLKLGLGMMAGAVFIMVQLLVLYLCGMISIEYQGLPWVEVLAGFLTFLGMAAIEECGSRGIVDTAFQKYGKVAAIVCSAIFFTVIHQDLWMEFSVLRLVELFLMGIALSSAMHATKSISFATGFHMAINVAAAVIFGFGTTEAIFVTTALKTNIFAGFEVGGAGLISLGLTALWIVGFYLFGKKSK